MLLMKRNKEKKTAAENAAGDNPEVIMGSFECHIVS
jgi:hypothetical protein